MDGLDTVSVKIMRVRSSISFSISSSGASGSNNLTSMPSFGSVTVKRLYVPPYSACEAIMLSPAPVTVAIARNVADIPEAHPMPYTPPSSAATLLSNAPTVGLASRE